MSAFAKKTFAAASYNQFRLSYPLAFYQRLMAYHQGPTHLVVDVGCGTGVATGALVPFFTTVEGYDASAKMISAAAVDDHINYHVSSSDALIHTATGAADMVTVAQAIHWFDHAKFFSEAHRVLRQGGTLAYWYYIDPVFPKYPALNRLVDKFVYDDARYLGPYWEQPGRSLLRNFLHDVRLPASFTSVERFEYHAETFQASDVVSPPPLFIHRQATLNTYFDYLCTASSYHAYTEANHLDVIEIMRAEINQEMGWSVKDNETAPLDLVFNTGYVFSQRGADGV